MLSAMQLGEADETAHLPFLDALLGRTQVHGSDNARLHDQEGPFGLTFAKVNWYGTAEKFLRSVWYI